MLENTEGAITNGQSRETGNIGYTRRRKTKQKHSTICVGHHYAPVWPWCSITFGMDEYTIIRLSN
jgi:hypothetical protein